MEKPNTIYERIHRIELHIEGSSKSTTNVFVIEDPNPMMIDTGPLSDENKRELEAGLETIGFRVEDIRRIVLTHGHVDHYGLAQWIWNRGKPTIFIHREDADKVRGKQELESVEDSGEILRTLLRFGVSSKEAEYMREFIKSRKKCAETIKMFCFIDESSSFEFKDFRLKVLHFPGHTSGSICLWNEGTGLLFSGDSLLPGTIPVPLIESKLDQKGQCYRGLVSYLEAVRRVRELNLRKVYPGHGETVEDVEQLFVQISNYWGKRKKEILDVIGEGRILPYQVVQWLLSKSAEYEEFVPYIKLSEVVGVLEVLEEEGLVESFEEESKHWYQKSKR